MGIGEKMRGYANSTQEGVKSSTLSLIHFTLRLLTGVVLGAVLGLIGQELIGYATFGVIFVMVVVLAATLKLLSPWSISKILIFDLICVLVGMLLRMYILVAP